jgi:hypothetical protein
MSDQVNFLNPNAFQFSLSKTPKTNFYFQATVIPGLGLPPVNLPTAYISVPVPGEELKFGEFSATFRIDEKMLNYMEIYNWMVNMSTLAKEGQSLWNNVNGLYSDANLIILDSHNNPVINVTYLNVFPTGLSALTFDTRLKEVQYLDCTVSFAYQEYDIVAV